MGILAGAGLLFGASANAQTYLSSSSSSSDDPTPWFIGGGLGYNLGFQSAKSSLAVDGMQGFKVQLFGGKWFTPSVGARLALDFGGFSPYSYKNATNRTLRGNYGNLLKVKNTTGYDGDIYYFGEKPYVHADLMWNVLNTFMGYDEYRRFSLIPYASIGVMAFRQSETYTRLAAGAGLMLDFRLTKALDLYFDFAVPAVGSKVANKLVTDSNLTSETYPGDDFMGDQSGLKQLAGLPRLGLGLIYRIGNCSKVAPVAPVSPRTDNSMEDRISKVQKEETESRNTVSNLEEVADDTNVRVYFTIGNAKLDDRAKSALDKFVENVMNKNSKVYEVVGMADAGTGSAKRNQKLSTQRAENVKSYLLSKGIPASRLTVKGIGGVTGESAAACRAVEVR